MLFNINFYFSSKKYYNKYQSTGLKIFFIFMPAVLLSYISINTCVPASDSASTRFSRSAAYLLMPAQALARQTSDSSSAEIEYKTTHDKAVSDTGPVEIQAADSSEVFSAGIPQAVAKPLSTEQISKISEIINKFADNIYNSKISAASKLCINTQSDFLSKDFIDDFKSTKGAPLKIKDISGSADETISVILEYGGDKKEDIMIQEFVLLYNAQTNNFLIANIFDRLYESINEDKKKCMANCSFLENALLFFQRILPDFSFSNEFRGDAAFKKLIDAGFLTHMPQCPSKGVYICLVSNNAELNSYEIMVGCSEHGYLSEISKLYTNLDNSEKLYAELENEGLRLSREHCGERLLKMFNSREIEKNIYESIRTEDIAGALELFKQLQKEEKHLGELYPALSDSLLQIDHETAAVTILKEAAEYYPGWPIIKDKLSETGNNR